MIKINFLIFKLEIVNFPLKLDVGEKLTNDVQLLEWRDVGDEFHYLLENN